MTVHVRGTRTETDVLIELSKETLTSAAKSLSPLELLDILNKTYKASLIEAGIRPLPEEAYTEDGKWKETYEVGDNRYSYPVTNTLRDVTEEEVAIFDSLESLKDLLLAVEESQQTEEET